MNPEQAASSPADLLHAEAREVLRRLTGVANAEFHDGQYEAIRALVADRARTLVVQRTGWGKSAVYFISSLLLRARGMGPALIVSPLLSLMRDQVEAASRAGVRAAMVNSANVTEWDEIRTRLEANELDVLLVGAPNASITRRSASSGCRTCCRAWGYSSLMRRTVFLTGATISAPTTAVLVRSLSLCQRACRCWRLQQPRMTVLAAISPNSSAPIRPHLYMCCAVRYPASPCAWAF